MVTKITLNIQFLTYKIKHIHNVMCREAIICGFLSASKDDFLRFKKADAKEEEECTITAHDEPNGV
jgi:hypothetical protein